LAEVGGGPANQPINIAAGSDSQWRALCGLLGEPGLPDDPRYTDPQDRLDHRAELRADLERLLAARGSAEWVPLIRAAGIPCGPIHRMDDVFADPQVQALDMAQQVLGPDAIALPMLRGLLWTGDTPSPVRLPPPALGRHTREILAATGLPDAEIDALRDRDIIVDAARDAVGHAGEERE